MRKHLLLLSIIIAFVASIAGCALMNKVLPGQVDANGQIISGTHQATASAQGLAGLIPYGIGSVLLNVIQLAWNGYEKFKADKVDKGLNATLIALNQVKDDPNLKADWEQIKAILSKAHIVSGVQPLIQRLLAKI